MTTYFENMVAINLFHEPTFYQKLTKIESPTQICALVMALRSFAVRFGSDEIAGNNLGDQADIHQRAAHYLEQTSDYINHALKECDDLTPPICILQASILSAHCQLTQGVLGKAWRALGTCVRLAYEMNLHLVDVNVVHGTPETHAAQWCEDEEKRRTWWAVWEMDVFATTIRRTPTAVDWSQIDTLLPVEDSNWLQCKPRASCFLESDPIYRWKTLQHSGNQSPKAWYIVINSLMKDAQTISSPRGVPSASVLDGTESREGSRIEFCPEKRDAARRRLEIIANAVQCFRLTLPNHLKYNNQYLGFEARPPGQYTSMRQDHCSIYNIYMMTQLTRLMVHRFDAFGKRFRAAVSSHDLDPPTHNRERANAQDQKDWTESLAIKQYFEAADDLLIIVRRSCDDHIRYINPLLSSTIWLASAVLLVRSQFCRPETMRSVIKSRYEVMHLTYKNCVDFWGMRTAVQQNLETLERQLEACERTDRGEGERHQSQRLVPRAQTQSGNAGSDGEGAQDASTLDFLHLAPQQTTAYSPTTLVDPALGLDQAMQFNPHDPVGMDYEFDWGYPRLSSDLQDMLSGFFTT